MLLLGKSGVGKSAIAALLSGTRACEPCLPRRHIASTGIRDSHDETAGLAASVTYWPVQARVGNRVSLLRLQLLDAGERALARCARLVTSPHDRSQIRAHPARVQQQH